MKTNHSRRSVLAGAALLVLALVLLVAGVLAGRPGTPDGRASSTTAATLSAGAVASPSIPPPPPTPAPTGPTSDANVLPQQLAAVQLGTPAAVGNGISATVVSLDPIDGTGRGPGNIAGPALRAMIRITNGTTQPQSVDAVAVDMTYGSERRPASPLDDPSQRPFRGIVRPGGSATGTYVFTVPADARSVVTVSVGYQAGAPFMVFTGAAR